VHVSCRASRCASGSTAATSSWSCSCTRDAPSPRRACGSICRARPRQRHPRCKALTTWRVDRGGGGRCLGAHLAIDRQGRRLGALPAGGVLELHRHVSVGTVCAAGAACWVVHFMGALYGPRVCRRVWMLWPSCDDQWWMASSVVCHPVRFAWQIGGTGTVGRGPACDVRRRARWVGRAGRSCRVVARLGARMRGARGGADALGWRFRPAKFFRMIVSLKLHVLGAPCTKRQIRALGEILGGFWIEHT
jgi:hypothetical protein